MGGKSSKLYYKTEDIELMKAWGIFPAKGGKFHNFGGGGGGGFTLLNEIYGDFDHINGEDALNGGKGGKGFGAGGGGASKDKWSPPKPTRGGKGADGFVLMIYL
jgi:hypothetical protein